MKPLLWALALALLPLSLPAQEAGTAAEQASLSQATQTIRDAFARGDVEAIVTLHDPGIIKYFGGANVITGRDELRQSLRSMLADQQMTFVENTVESTVFVGETAIQAGLFAIRFAPKDGQPSHVFRGRSLVVYILSKASPTGWRTLREITQEAPALPAAK